MKRWLPVFLVLALASTSVGSAYGAIAAYITGSSEPWGTNSNQNAMTAAFGAGAWNQFTFANAVGSGVFTPGAYQFLYFDGGDGQDTPFYSFVGANRTALQNWVASGGSLFLNSAGWTSVTLDVGFGAQLNLGGSYSNTGTALGPHPIFDATTGTSWTGNYFSHDTVTGSGLTNLIDGFAGTVLAEKDWGAGHVMIGGMTSAYFHAPQAEAFNLRVNILQYGADWEPAVPEPSTLITWSLLAGLGIGACWWRRKRTR